MLYQYNVLSTLLIVTFSIPSIAQFANPSFEGPRGQGMIPPGWSKCHQLSTPDTQPQTTFVNTAPSDGSTYVSLVTRGDLGPYARTAEDIQTTLSMPINVGQALEFSIDLAKSATFGHYIDWDSEFLSYNRAVILKIWSGEEKCGKDELAWESPPIDHTEWRTYRFTIAPKQKNVHSIVLQAEFVGTTHYFGNILLDNIQLCTVNLDHIVSTYEICSGNHVSIDLKIQDVEAKWSDGIGSLQKTFTKGGIYVLTISNGCISNDVVFQIVEKSCNCELWAPNIFTPNGDNVNDFFELTSDLEAARFQLTVFNRWGVKVFESTDIQKSWNGYSKFDPVTSGVYYYTAHIMCISDGKILENKTKGVVNVVR